MVVKIITKEQLHKLAKEHEVLVVNFHANWCGPCRMYAPIFKEVSEERNDIKMGSVDIDLSVRLSHEFDIQSIPTTIAFKDGKEIGRFFGFVYKEDLNLLIDRIKYGKVKDHLEKDEEAKIYKKDFEELKDSKEIDEKNPNSSDGDFIHKRDIPNNADESNKK